MALIVDEVSLLNQRISDLEEHNRLLTEHVAFLSHNTDLARGMTGERLIADLVGGSLTPHTSSFDIRTDAGLKIEVKNGKLLSPNVGKGGRRWMWNKITGQTNSKVFDYLVLVGAADDRFRHQYRDAASPYIIFLIPYEDVGRLLTKGNPWAILLNTNPDNASGKAKALYNEFQISADELKTRLAFRPVQV